MTWCSVNTVQNISMSNRLEQIGTICREALDSMSDIVWAMNRERIVSNLVQRMRSLGEEMLTSRGLYFRLSDNSALNSSAHSQVRHDVFLLFKGAIHNVVRHARAKSVDVELSTTLHDLVLRIVDDGCGFSEQSNLSGHGLCSMRERVAGSWRNHAGGDVRERWHIFEVYNSYHENPLINLGTRLSYYAPSKGCGDRFGLRIRSGACHRSAAGETTPYARLR